MSEKNVFQKIIDREIPATIIYEDQQMLVFLDINPVHKGHLLLIPKESYTWMQDASDELIAYMFVQAKKFMIALKTAVSADYVEVAVIGKDVPHFHIHLIPRYFNDNMENLPHEGYASSEEKEEYGNKIKNAL